MSVGVIGVENFTSRIKKYDIKDIPYDILVKIWSNLIFAYTDLIYTSAIDSRYILYIYLQLSI